MILPASIVPALRELKPVAESILARRGPARMALAWRGARDCVLGYHNVLPHGAPQTGDRSLHMPRSRFASHLDQVQEDCEVVPLLDLLRNPRSDGDAPPRVALTFDDGYRGALTEGLDELRSRGLPATFFIPPGCLGDTTFWWDAVRDGKGDPLSGPARDTALEAYRGDRGAVLAWARRRGFRVREAEPVSRSVTEAELARVARVPSVTVGSHGWSHGNLAVLPPPALSNELKRSHDWLRARFDSFVPVISYPYGSANRFVEGAAARRGYEAGIRVDGGTFSEAPPEPFAIPRINAPAGLSPDGLRLRLAGILS